jgi:hypothetical protein
MNTSGWNDVKRILSFGAKKLMKLKMKYCQVFVIVTYKIRIKDKGKRFKGKGGKLGS